MKKTNIAIGGGACTGKSTLAAELFARLKETGYDFDLVNEESRRLAKEFGSCRSPFDRFYLWRQQEREELRSSARDGFITDTPLFQYYAHAIQWKQEPRDDLAVRELFRMCMEIKDRYTLFVIAENPREIRYKNDGSRKGKWKQAVLRHQIIRTFVDHFIPEKVLYVSGSLEERTTQVLRKLYKMGFRKIPPHFRTAQGLK